MDLFEHRARKDMASSMPLAERMRPRTLDEFVGQQDITGPGTLIRNAIESDRIFSMILWGPPGCGKTSLAGIIASETRSHFMQISAVLSGIGQIRSVIEEARTQLNFHRRRTILFVDEIHRFNKSQQDAFLPHVESGLITLIGATTENPSFEVISALISRCRVIPLKPLSPEDITVILKRAIEDRENGIGKLGLTFPADALALLIQLADGDVRVALNNLEAIADQLAPQSPELTGAEKIPVELSDVERLLQKKCLLYDKSGEEHFNLISALHKSLRGSDPDAAVYWLVRMLKAGEDPFYIARRMVRFATEDVGVADPHALGFALDAMEAYRFLGSPEGDEALIQAAVYLATAPKSNSLHKMYKAVQAEIHDSGALPVPHHIRNAPTRLMKDMGYGAGYKYAHDYPGGYVDQEYLPDPLRNQRYYFPTGRGYEKTIAQRLDGWRNFKMRAAGNAESDQPESSE